MDPAHPPTATPTPTPGFGAERPRRGCLGCFVTTGLGCAAFLVGALGAAVGFAPSMLGGVFAAWIEDWVDENIDGRIEVGELQLSWRRRQKAKDLRLYDPDGEQVLQAEVTFPSLLHIFDDKRGAWEVRVRIEDGDVRLDEAGVTNLQRALATRGELGGSRSGRIRVDRFDSSSGMDQPFDYVLTVSGVKDAIEIHDLPGAQGGLLVERLELELGHQPGRPERITLELAIDAGATDEALTLAGSLSLPAGGRPLACDLRLALADLPTGLVDGLLGPPPHGHLAEVLGETLTGHGTLVGEGGQGIDLELTLGGPDRDPVVIRGSVAEGTHLSCARFPTLLIDRYAGREGLLVELFGDDVAVQLESPLAYPWRGPCSFVLDSTDGRSHAAGRLADGRVSSADGDRIALGFRPGPRVERELLARLIPWMEVLEAPEGPLRLEAEGFVLPIDGDPAAFRATLSLSLGHLRYRLEPGFRALFPPLRDGPSELDHTLPPMRMTVEREMVTYDEVVLMLGDEECELEGSIDLRRRSLGLRTSVPMAFVLAGGGKVPEEFTVPVTLTGPWSQPSLSVDRKMFEVLSKSYEFLREKLTGGDGD